MSENGKNVPLIVCDFHAKWRDFKVSYLKFWEVVDLLGEKFTFQLPLDSQNFQESQTFRLY